MTRPPTRSAASIRARLLNLQRAGGARLETLLVAYGLERVLYRLSISSVSEAFVLKGGMLVSAWLPGARFTRDLDFLGHGPTDVDALRSTFAELMRDEHPDGLVFDIAGLRALPIMAAHETGGVRLVTRATLDGARVPITIDIGYGDAIATPTELMSYPTLLDMPPPRVHAYSPETVLAEKLHAVVSFAGMSTRVKDLYDLWRVPSVRRVDADELVRSLRATFERRGTELPEERPPGLSHDYAGNVERRAQWRQYLVAVRVEEVSLVVVVDEIWQFLHPFVDRARGER